MISIEQMRAGSNAYYKGGGVDFSQFTPEVKWWLGAHVDGDGSIRIDRTHGGMSISVAKAENAWDTLTYLKNLMGGTISFHAPARGEKQAQKQWYLTGKSAADFCTAMADFILLKRPQALVAQQYATCSGWLSIMNPIQGTHKTTGETVTYASSAQAAKELHIPGPNIADNLAGRRRSAGGYMWTRIENPIDQTAISQQRKDLIEKIAALKKVPHESISCDLPLPYVAGFLDADGMIRANEVSISQKYIAICDAFKAQFGGRIYHNNDTDVWSWHVTKKSEVRDIVSTIYPYLIEKKKQAGILLAADVSTPSSKTNANMSVYKGFQGAAKNAINAPLRS